jgi:hypothetical protein
MPTVSLGSVLRYLLRAVLRESTAGTVQSIQRLGCRLDERRIRVQFPARAEMFFFTTVLKASIPGASRLSEKQRVWNGVHSASLGQLRSYLEEIVTAPVYETEINDRENPLR